MKLRLEYESVCSSLLNRSHVPSLDICFELLHKERLCTQAILEQSHASFEKTTMAHAAQGHGSPVISKNMQCFYCKEYGHIAVNCPKKYCCIRPQNRQAKAFHTCVPLAMTSVAHGSSSSATSDIAPLAAVDCTSKMV